MQECLHLLSSFGIDRRCTDKKALLNSSTIGSIKMRRGDWPWKNMKNGTTFVRMRSGDHLGRLKNVKKGHLAQANLTFLLIVIDRNVFRRMKEELQIYKVLPRIFHFLPWDLVMIFQSLVMTLPRFLNFERPKLSMGGAVANRLRRRTSDQTVLGSNPAVAAALSPWTRLFTPIVPRRSLHISFY